MNLNPREFTPDGRRMKSSGYSLVPFLKRLGEIRPGGAGKTSRPFPDSGRPPERPGPPAGTPVEFLQTALYPKSPHRTPEDEQVVRRLLRGRPDLDLIREASLRWPMPLFDYAIARVKWDTDPDRRAIVRRLLILRRTLAIDVRIAHLAAAAPREGTSRTAPAGRRSADRERGRRQRRAACIVLLIAALLTGLILARFEVILDLFR